MSETEKNYVPQHTIRLTLDEFNLIADYMANAGVHGSIGQFIKEQGLDQARVRPSKHHFSKGLQQTFWKGNDEMEDLRTYLAAVNRA